MGKEMDEGGNGVRLWVEELLGVTNKIVAMGWCDPGVDGENDFVLWINQFRQKTFCNRLVSLPFISTQLHHSFSTHLRSNSRLHCLTSMFDQIVDDKQRIPDFIRECLFILHQDCSNSTISIVVQEDGVIIWGVGGRRVGW